MMKCGIVGDYSETKEIATFLDKALASLSSQNQPIDREASRDQIPSRYILTISLPIGHSLHVHLGDLTSVKPKKQPANQPSQQARCAFLMPLFQQLGEAQVHTWDCLPPPSSTLRHRPVIEGTWAPQCAANINVRRVLPLSETSHAFNHRMQRYRQVTLIWSYCTHILYIYIIIYIQTYRP